MPDPMTQGPRTVAVEAVEAALRAGDQLAGIRLARQALDSGEIHPLLLNLRAYWYETQNRLDAALVDLQQAVALAPDDPVILNACGLCLVRANRPAEATALFSGATALKPDFGPAWFSLGDAAERINDLQTARAAYERAAPLATVSPLPAAHLASLAARRGDWAEARRRGEAALALDSALTLAKRAIVAADIAQKDYAAAETRIDAMLAAPACGWEDAYFAHSLRGDIRHAEGRYGEAFAAYVEGGRIARAAGEARLGRGRSIRGTVEWLTRAFTASAPWPASGAMGAPAPEASGAPLGHAFLLGFPRSGTTLLEQAFAARPDVVSLEEQEALADSARQFMTNPEGLAPLAVLGEVERRPYVEHYWGRVRAFGVEPAGRFFIDKLPFNTLKLPLIARLFPGAKVLFALRDPRDVVLSCLRQRFRIGAYTYELLTPEAAARFYAATMTLASLYAEKLPLHLRYVRHEAVVEDFDGELRATSAFLGLEWDERMRDFAARAATHPAATPSAVQLTKGLSREGLGQWRKYRSELEPILPILQPWVEKYGYPAD